MTVKEKENYNKMLSALRAISKEYGTSDWIRANHEKVYGSDDYAEVLEMAYDNIKDLAENASKGIKYIKP